MQLLNVHSRKGLVLVGLLAVSMFAGGCGRNLRAERDALYTQNVQLQEELNALREGLDVCESEQGRLNDRIAELIAEKNDALASADNTVELPVAEPVAAVPAEPTGFEGLDPQITVSTTPSGQVSVQIPGDLLFDSGKATLRTNSKATLSRIAQIIRSKHPGKDVRVEGYADSDPIRRSKWKDNLELSAHRAMSVQRQLQTAGIHKDSLYSAAFGVSRPAAPNTTRANKAKNRRVEIIVLQ